MSSHMPIEDQKIPHVQAAYTAPPLRGVELLAQAEKFPGNRSAIYSDCVGAFIDE